MCLGTTEGPILKVPDVTVSPGRISSPFVLKTVPVARHTGCRTSTIVTPTGRQNVRLLRHGLPVARAVVRREVVTAITGLYEKGSHMP